MGHPVHRYAAAAAKTKPLLPLLPLLSVTVRYPRRYTAAAARLRALAEAQWPGAADGSLREAILRSQRERRLVQRAMQFGGRRTHWDYQPSEDASALYARNTADALQDQEYVARAPFRGLRPEPRGGGVTNGN